MYEYGEVVVVMVKEGEGDLNYVGEVVRFERSLSGVKKRCSPMTHAESVSSGASDCLVLNLLGDLRSSRICCASLKFLSQLSSSVLSGFLPSSTTCIRIGSGLVSVPPCNRMAKVPQYRLLRLSNRCTILPPSCHLSPSQPPYSSGQYLEVLRMLF